MKSLHIVKFLVALAAAAGFTALGALFAWSL